MNTPLFFTILIAFGFSCLWIGKRAGQSASNNEEYFLMGRKLGFFSLMMTLLATQVGGGALMGAAEEAYTKGWMVLFYPLGMVIGLLILGMGFGAKMRRLALSTVAEIFEKKYGSVNLRQIASLLSIISLFFIIVGQGIAARKLIHTLGLGGDTLFILFWLILVTYTVMGGLKAVVKTDMLQAGFIIVAFAIAMIMMGNRGPIEPTAITSITESTPWLTWLLMPLFFMLVAQDMGQRCFAAKSPKVVSLASVTAGIGLLLISLAPIFFGTLAGKSGLAIPAHSSVLISSVMAFTSPTIATCLICAILMAIISTADSLLCSISSNIVCDFPRLSAKGVWFSRLLTLLVGLSSLGLAFYFTNVVTMLMFSYEITAAVLFTPVLMGVLMKNPSKRSAILSMIVGASSFIILQGFSPVLPKALISLCLAFGSFVVSEALIPAPQKSIKH